LACPPHGRGGLALNQNIENNPMQSRKGAVGMEDSGNMFTQFYTQPTENQTDD
jgi:hypothetical protein